MEMGQLLLSLLHAWGLDPDLDRLCETKLGLLRPMVPVSFGVISKAGNLSLQYHLKCSHQEKATTKNSLHSIRVTLFFAFRHMFTIYSQTTILLICIGYMSLQLPTWQLWKEVKPETQTALASDLPPELLHLEALTREFTAQYHWELSTSITTNHLLAIISIANTLMSMNNASFVAEQERSRKLLR